MTTNEIVVDSFDRIHEVVTKSITGMSEADLTFRPKDGANTITWLVWHIGRVQDAQVADLAGQPQLWEQWREKFNLDLDENATGYGMGEEEVGKVTASAELLIDYLNAVHEASVKYIETLKDDDYDRVIDTNWNPPVTVGARLVSIIADCLQHAGQVGYVKGLKNNVELT